MKKTYNTKTLTIITVLLLAVISPFISCVDAADIVANPAAFIQGNIEGYKKGLEELQTWYRRNCGEPQDDKEKPGDAAKPEPKPPKPPQITISGNNPFDPTNPLGGSSAATPSAIVSSASGGSSGGGSSGGGSSGTLTTSWGNVGGTSMTNLILGGSSTLNAGSSSSPNLAFVYTPGGSTYGASPQNGYYWCDTGMTNTRNRALNTTSTDRVRVGGASGVTYIVTHTANTSGVTVTNITK
jgi:hypothetical protein